MKPVVTFLLSTALVAGAASAATAQPPLGDPYGGRQQDEARAAVQGGQVRPLEDIVQLINRRTPGAVLSASAPLFQPDGRIIYRILWDHRGRQLEYIVDARSGVVLAVKGD